MENLGIYIHIPFCEHKCIYCDFYSVITNENRPGFLEALKKEIKTYSGKFAGDKTVKSIFFGGGTPSLLEVPEIEEILNTLAKEFKIEAPEITLETNPGTVDLQKLKDFLKAGINRLSVGVQSFDDKELEFLTRIHNSGEAKKTIFDATEVGFENISIDLIFNLPGQTKRGWEENLRTAVGLPVKHISAYSLILERGTILNKMVLDGKVKISDEDYDADLYEFTMQYIKSHGFRQYEVSNFAKPGYECRHNKFYWDYTDYLGFGPSAHSFVEGVRWRNFSSLKKYISEIRKSGKAICAKETLSEKEKLEEFVMLSLRSEGLDLKRLREEFSPLWEKKNKNLLEFLNEEQIIKFAGDKVILTEKGYSLCDEILTKFEY